MARDNLSPILKIPNRSPKTKGKLKENKIVGPIRIIHSDSTVSVASVCSYNIESNKKSKSISSNSSHSSDNDLSYKPKSATMSPLPPEVDVEDEAPETPLLCCRLFALLATCFEHVEDQVEGGKSWCQRKFLSRKASSKKSASELA